MDGWKKGEGKVVESTSLGCRYALTELSRTGGTTVHLINIYIHTTVGTSVVGMKSAWQIVSCQSRVIRTSLTKKKQKKKQKF